jgi:hypothetical protein
MIKNVSEMTDQELDEFMAAEEIAQNAHYAAEWAAEVAMIGEAPRREALHSRNYRPNYRRRTRRTPHNWTGD